MVLAAQRLGLNLETIAMPLSNQRVGAGMGLCGKVMSRRLAPMVTDSGVSTRKRRLTVLVIMLASIVGITWAARAVWYTYNVEWRSVATVGEMSIMVVEASRYLDTQPDVVTTESVRCAIMDGYSRRTGKRRPVDAWGNSIRVHIHLDNDIVHLAMTSSGPDRQYGTPDDVVRTYQLSTDLSDT